MWPTQNPQWAWRNMLAMWRTTCQNHQGQISFMLHQHDVVLMLKVRMSGSCTVSRLSSLAAVQHHLKMQIWTTPDTGQSYKNRQDYNQRIINVRTSVWRLLSWWTVHLHLAHRLKHTFTWHWWNGYSRQILINKPTISPTCVAVQIFREKLEFICSYSLQINADTKKQ